MEEAGKENAVGGWERIECWIQYWLSDLLYLFVHILNKV